MCLIFHFGGLVLGVYVKLDPTDRIHKPCAELCYPDDIRSGVE